MQLGREIPHGCPPTPPRNLSRHYGGANARKTYVTLRLHRRMDRSTHSEVEGRIYPNRTNIVTFHLPYDPLLSVPRCDPVARGPTPFTSATTCAFRNNAGLREMPTSRLVLFSPPSSGSLMMVKPTWATTRATRWFFHSIVRRKSVGRDPSHSRFSLRPSHPEVKSDRRTLQRLGREAELLRPDHHILNRVCPSWLVAATRPATESGTRSCDIKPVVSARVSWTSAIGAETDYNPNRHCQDFPPPLKTLEWIELIRAYVRHSRPITATLTDRLRVLRVQRCAV